VRKSGVWLCVMVVCGLFLYTDASAKEIHVYKSSFGSQGSGAGQFNGPAGVAVDDVTHDIYVVDKDNDRVEKFNATGTEFICQFNGSGSATGSFSEPTEIAVDNSGKSKVEDPSVGDVYVVDRGHGVIDKFSSSCVYQNYQLTGVDTPGSQPFDAGENAPRAIEGVAVDPGGALWVGTNTGPIYSFSNALENGYVSERTTAFGGSGEGLAVDAEDNLYFTVGGGEVVKVNSTGETLIHKFCSDEKAFRVSYDPATREVYLDDLEMVKACSATGTLIESFGFGRLTFSKGLAVDASDGTVYVADQSADSVSIFEAIILPSVAVKPVSAQRPRSVTLNGTVSPEGRPVTSCVFEYGTSVAYGQSVPCSPAAASLGSGVNLVPVNAHLDGLIPETEYHYRLVTENAGAISSSTTDQNFFTGPLVGGEFVTDVASSSATVHASVDPNGADAHYYLEYGPTVAYGSYAPSGPPGNDLGSTVGEQRLSLHLQGLEADTGYHYRFVVVQDGEVFETPDDSFMTQSASVSAGSPDGRVWELVSPANKGGVLIELLQSGGQVQAAANGSGIAYLTVGASLAENPAGKIEISQVLSRRGVDGWESEDLTLPGQLPENGESIGELFHPQFEYHAFSPDLSLAGVEPQQVGTPALSAEVAGRTLYLRDNVSNDFLALVSASNVPPGTSIEEPTFYGVAASEWEMHFLAATPDLAHVVFKTPLALTPEAIDEETVQNHVPGHDVQWNLYEWSGGQLQLVNILPGGEVAHGPEPATPPVRLAGMTSASGLARGGVQRDVSEDGRRVAWTWGEPYTPAELTSYRGLYVRDMVEERTFRIGGPTAIYQTMSSDGKRIFFLENGDLYLYDLDSETQTDLTSSHGAGNGNAGVQELVSDVDRSGIYVYFVAKGVLAQGGVSGKNNLYVLHDTGSEWNIKNIAVLSTEDSPSWYARGLFGVPFLANVSSRVSPNGRFLAFMSDRSLTSYDNTDAVSGEPDEEVYLYDAQSGRLVCASCDPSGARPAGVFDGGSTELSVDRAGTWIGRNSTEASKRFDHWLAGSVPGWDNLDNSPPTYQPRYLSDSGRLFFDSPVGLVGVDTNGLEDVYEFEPEGVGDCSPSVASGTDVYVGQLAGRFVGGCVGLISSGTSGSESAFYDASENGNDVFFNTTGKLVGEDYDNGYDVYDAHVCSSAVPCKVMPVVPPPCESGDSCKAAPSLQPGIFGPPSSATFSGAGNVSVARHVVVKRRVLSAAQRRRLARALKACRTKRGKRRNVCERRVRKAFSM
jgi:WD40-like Beta Propeller Repeat